MVRLGDSARVRGWDSVQRVDKGNWDCGYCGKMVGSDQGWVGTQDEGGSGSPTAYIRICPNCQLPTVFDHAGDYAPTRPPGEHIDNVPEDLSTLYEEARYTAGAGAYTAAVMACRKMLMNIAVDKGAKEGLGFAEYVNYLVSEGYTPPNSKEWVDYVRSLGNEANHKIALKDRDDADAAITFVGMLLRFIYELPALIPSKVKALPRSQPVPGNSPNPTPAGPAMG